MSDLATLTLTNGDIITVRGEGWSIHPSGAIAVGVRQKLLGKQDHFKTRTYGPSAWVSIEPFEE